MAAIAESNVTYTMDAKSVRKLEDGRKMVHATIAFGDGVLTYPSGGVPVSLAKVGVPTKLYSVNFDDSHGNGHVFKFDMTNSKILIFDQDVGGSLAEVSGAIPAQTLIMTFIGY